MLDNVGAREVDVAVVTAGESFEGVVLCVSMLAELGVKVIFARATNDRQATVLRRVGATRAIQVENEMGRRLAVQVLNPVSSHLLDFATHFRVVPWKATAIYVGKTLSDADFRRFELNVLGWFGGAEGHKPRRVLRHAGLSDSAPGTRCCWSATRAPSSAFSSTPRADGASTSCPKSVPGSTRPRFAWVRGGSNPARWASLHSVLPLHWEKPGRATPPSQGSCPWRALLASENQLTAMSIDILFIDGCHTHDTWPETSAAVRALLERSGRFAIDHVRAPVPEAFNADFSRYAAVIPYYSSPAEARRRPIITRRAPVARRNAPGAGALCPRRRRARHHSRRQQRLRRVARVQPHDRSRRLGRARARGRASPLPERARRGHPRGWPWPGGPS